MATFRSCRSCKKRTNDSQFFITIQYTSIIYIIMVNVKWSPTHLFTHICKKKNNSSAMGIKSLLFFLNASLLPLPILRLHGDSSTENFYIINVYRTLVLNHHNSKNIVLRLILKYFKIMISIFGSYVNKLILIFFLRKMWIQLFYVWYTWVWQFIY